MYDYIRDPAAITRRSFEMIGEEADLAALPADIAPLAERMIHACGMTDLVADLRFSPGAGEAGRRALAAGAQIICDVHMVAAGLLRRRLAGNPVAVALTQAGADSLAARSGQSRTAAGMERLRNDFGGAIVIVGNAPTALFRLLELVDEGAEAPALVLGLPVGFVGAAESKQALAAQDKIPFVTLLGRRGGSAIAAAAMNALILGGARS